MALFKLFKGNESDLIINKLQAVDGSCYFCEDTGKFYIDISDGTAEIGTNRISINSHISDVSDRLPFGTCQTATTTAVKEITTSSLAGELQLDSTTKLPQEGTMMAVYFEHASGATPSLKITGVNNNEAIPVYFGPDATNNFTATGWEDFSVYMFMFMTVDNSPRWIIVNSNKYARFADSANLASNTTNGVVRFKTNATFTNSNVLIDDDDNVTIPGRLNVNQETYLNDETYAEDITTNTLLVNGNSRFEQIPTTATAAAGTNDNQVATTAFVTNAVTNKTMATLTIGTYQYDGTTSVTIPTYDGSYN